MEVDETDSEKFMVKNNCWHHKIFLTKHIPNGMGAESEQENSRKNREMLYRRGILNNRNRPDTPVLEPGHIIKFYMPGMAETDEWLRVAIVYSTNSKYIPGKYHIHTTFQCPLPNYLPVRIVGKLGESNDEEIVTISGQA